MTRLFYTLMMICGAMMANGVPAPADRAIGVQEDKATAMDQNKTVAAEVCKQHQNVHIKQHQRRGFC